MTLKKAINFRIELNLGQMRERSKASDTFIFEATENKNDANVVITASSNYRSEKKV